MSRNVTKRANGISVTFSRNPRNVYPVGRSRGSNLSPHPPFLSPLNESYASARRSVTLRLTSLSARSLAPVPPLSLRCALSTGSPLRHYRHSLRCQCSCQLNGKTDSLRPRAQLVLLRRGLRARVLGAGGQARGNVSRCTTNRTPGDVPNLNPDLKLAAAPRGCNKALFSSPQLLPPRFSGRARLLHSRERPYSRPVPHDARTKCTTLSV